MSKEKMRKKEMERKSKELPQKAEVEKWVKRRTVAGRQGS